MREACPSIDWDVCACAIEQRPYGGGIVDDGRQGAGDDAKKKNSAQECWDCAGAQFAVERAKPEAEHIWFRFSCPQ